MPEGVIRRHNADLIGNGQIVIDVVGFVHAWLRAATGYKIDMMLTVGERHLGLAPCSIFWRLVQLLHELAVHVVIHP